MAKKITKIFKIAVENTAIVPTHEIFDLSEKVWEELQITISERRSSGLDLTTGKKFQPFNFHNRPMVNLTYGQEEIDPETKTVRTPLGYKPEGFTFCEGEGLPIRIYSAVKNVWVDSEGWVCTHCPENWFDMNPYSDHTLKGVDWVIENLILETGFIGKIHFEFGRHKDLFQFLSIKVGSATKPCVFDKIRYTSRYGNKTFRNLTFSYWRMDADCPKETPTQGICCINSALDYKKLGQRYVSSWEAYKWFDDIDRVWCESHREVWAYQNTLQEMVDAITPYKLGWMSTILNLLRFQIMVDNGEKIPVTQFDGMEYESSTHEWENKLEYQTGSSVPLIHTTCDVFFTKDPKEFNEIQVVNRIHSIEEDDIKLEHKLDISKYLTDESKIDKYTVTPITSFEVILNDGTHLSLGDVFLDSRYDEKKLSDIKAGRFLIKERREEGGISYSRIRPYLDPDSLVEWEKE